MGHDARGSEYPRQCQHDLRQSRRRQAREISEMIRHDYRDADSVLEQAPAAGPPRDETARREPVEYPASESIGLLMRIALFGVRASFKETLAKHRVPWSAWYYLRVLWEADGISQRELTERVGTMQPN